MEYTIISFSKGKLFLAKGPKGLNTVQFLKKSDPVKKALVFFQKKDIAIKKDDGQFSEEKKLFERYFSGKTEDFKSLTLDLSFGTPFHQRVWREARRIPHGKITTYKSLSRRLKHNGYRSIGQAMAKNPLLIIVPCHRVIRTDGSLGGFGPGLHVKEYLLKLEKGSNDVDLKSGKIKKKL
jgi:O-6-methylguanine DNA methyltransferase